MKRYNSIVRAGRIIDILVKSETEYEKAQEQFVGCDNYIGNARTYFRFLDFFIRELVEIDTYFLGLNNEKPKTYLTAYGEDLGKEIEDNIHHFKLVQADVAYDILTAELSKIDN